MISDPNTKKPAKDNILRLIILRSLFVIAVIIFVSGAVYGLTQYQEKPLSYEDSYKISDKKEGKKTFVSKEYGYQFSYPANWELDNARDPQQFFFSVWHQEDGVAPDRDQKGMRFVAYISPEPEYSLSEKVDLDLREYGEAGLESRKSLTIDGHPAEQLSIRVFGHTYATYIKLEDYFVVFTANIIATTDMDRYRQMYEELLSTVEL
ncbi:MAG: hypothetical protein A2898_03530 [Candidatus Kerfeldbacteria bacterium RIFCSPLOWO2_01_FULL_48_11]|uniref:PsbP C-terminal domain-containing protein n=1 Tax=Candidatus Kerfeldbacteria bacterium RIFCSPLOWO2_01_FULL_48_11 TaxID=1798543 RepID=A0A1G2B541_9BACT|nr:MAG: hypothetical protein UY34_C0010G0011 [Parcubacteria group bacterium GW2011_GWA2_48_9]KKW16263.1 MAG: hypothetical protein UY52_C0007G0023 [Parcubacteria group bacterium GW2011_GWC2_49_9]OGY83330.1 MAG: hypothetical protein A2898_03530 [Candidatus Kerfeldbacteria bacterium RIFCSPLOWO2_01_FULL_48_11]HCJ52123.1 hypothetical protein [Candidatus Kerfeldbacteria bacterium]HCM68747.1 hypothetical protein [Candidatus Kerfeldbacteria bacterium]